MTIKPFREWGREISTPEDLLVAGDDADFVRLITERPGVPVAVAGGDLFRTIGARPIGDRARVRSLPLDLLCVTIDEAPPVTAVAHVVARTPTMRGGWWRGPVVIIMNVEFLGDWVVASRGHPNDGRAERFDLDGRTSVRQRRAVARRLPAGNYLPHPAITCYLASHHVVEFDDPVSIALDGVDRGRARRVEVTVAADAATVFI